MSSDDRRIHPRFPLVLAVQYLGAESVLDYTENLSATGLFIRTEREFAVAERVALVISFPQLLEPVEIEVEVVRMRPATADTPAGVAVRVPEDRPQDRERLQEVAHVVSGARAPDDAVRVLVVEDNALVAAMYASALRRMSEGGDPLPVVVETAGDGGQALDRLLRTPRIDVVVTDVFMPVSGITLLEKMRAEPALASTPAVVISSGGDAVRDRAAALGVSSFLRKPVNYAELAGAVRQLLAQAAGRIAASPGGEAPSGGLTGEDPGRKDQGNDTPAIRR
ncbi:MAG: response regulator [Anaeromyxobacteraceae bacterium]